MLRQVSRRVNKSSAGAFLRETCPFGRGCRCVCEWLMARAEEVCGARMRVTSEVRREARERFDGCAIISDGPNSPGAHSGRAARKPRGDGVNARGCALHRIEACRARTAGEPSHR